MSDQARTSLYNINTISIQYHAGEWWEQRKISGMGLSVDPTPNSWN